jgi:hypothetical protein
MIPIYGNNEDNILRFIFFDDKLMMLDKKLK